MAPARPDPIARLAGRVAARAAAHGLRTLAVASRGDGALIVKDGRVLLDFASNDYLGLASHSAVRQALVDCAGREGVGATAAHLIGGHRPDHDALEREVAAWLGHERALLFTSGWAANLGVMQALLGDGDTCVEDKLNHASLLDAARLAGCELRRYVHADAGSARRQLASRPGTCALLATDGVFSMDGDIAPLAALAEVARESGAALMVDDAHGAGVLGPEGRGSVAHAGLAPRDVPIHVVTLGKALGVAGAIVAGPAALIEGLVQFARTYVYTTASPPVLAAATRAALRVARHEDWRRDRLARLVAHFRRGAARRGIALAGAATPIQPVPAGTSARALALAAALAARGFHVPAIRPPTVPEGAARLRVALSVRHAERDVDDLLDALAASLEETQDERRNRPRADARHARLEPRARRVRLR